MFDAVVPVLVLLASVLLGLQPWLKWAASHRPNRGTPDRLPVLLPAIFFAAVYGGYFGGALGVILIATLSLCAGDELKRSNATKGVLSLVVATVTVVIFALRAPASWAAVGLLAPSTLVGGYLGARLARRLPENALARGGRAAGPGRGDLPTRPLRSSDALGAGSTMIVW